MIYLTKLFEAGRIKRAVGIGKDAAQLTGEVAKDVGEKSFKTGSHIYRHKNKYGFTALGVGGTLALQKGVKAVKSAFNSN